MTEAFSRTERLLGKENMDRLAKAKVLIFGIGGVGGHVVEALARMGIGYLELVDNDVVRVILTVSLLRQGAPLAGLRLMLCVNVFLILIRMRLLKHENVFICRIRQMHLISQNMIML